MGTNALTGYETTEEQERRFIQWVAECRYGRLELARWVGVVPVLAGVFTVGAGPLSRVLGYPALTLPFIVAGLFLVLLGAFRMGANGGRRNPKGNEDEWACYGENELLKPRLFDGESLVAVVPANARIRTSSRFFMGGLQIVWGSMLAGLPLATVAGGEESVMEYQFWISAFTTIGMIVLARGLRDMFFLVPVAQWALTNQRLVAMGGPGVARSLWFETLVHKPLVIPRSENTATFALELRKLVSAGMLPMRGLWGVDEMNREQAESWARAVIAGRDKSSKGSA